MALVQLPQIARLTGNAAPIDSGETLRAIQKRKCEQSLSYFIRKAWSIIEPGQPYVHGWHIDFLCTHLEAITAGMVIDDTPYNRLLINVPPGPMRDDSQVETARGRILLRDVQVGDMVLTHKGRYRRVEAVHHQGVLPILKITTHSGRVTHAAPSHPYLTPRGWIDAGHLEVGDILAVVNREEDRPNASTVRPELARWLGYLIGDGSLTQGTINFTNQDDEAIEDFINCTRAIGFEPRPVRMKTYWRVSVLGGKPVHDLLKQHNLFGKNSYAKRIPKQILNADIKTISNFIGAYWTCDGGFDVRPDGKRGSRYRAYGTTVSEGLAEDLIYALGLLGIESRLRRKSRALETKSQPGGVYRSFSIEVQKEHMTAKFAKMPGLCEAKRSLARQCGGSFDQPLWNDPIVSIGRNGSANCMCLTVDEDHSFVCSGIAVKNTMKSLTVGVFWPAWEWGPMNMPHMRYVCASHSQDLAIRDGLRMRRLVMSEWYQSNWGDRVILTGDQNQKTKFENKATGFRQATASGSITGARGDRVIIDDPLSVDGANSDAIRATTNTWFLESVPTRLNNPKTSAIVVVMQRLHEEDVSGVILEKELGYDHIMLPMRYDPARAMPTKLDYRDPREEDGELLFPERFPIEVVDRDEKAMGPYATAGQFQQTPEPRGGGIIKRDWWQLWDNDAYPMMDYVIASVDTAYTDKTENDPSALTIWGIYSQDTVAQTTKTIARDGTLYDHSMRVSREFAEQHPKLMMMHAWHAHLPLHELVQKVAESCKRLKVDMLLIEGMASGLSVAQEIRRLYGSEPWGVQIINPGSQDKLSRLYSVQHLFAEGLIYAPDRAWADAVITQCAQFPRAKHDDLVDTVSMALRHLRSTGALARAAEHVEEIERAKSVPSKLAPLYDV